MTYSYSLSSLSLASSYSRGISLFSQAHGRWRSHQGQPAHAGTPICNNMEHTQFVDITMYIYVSEVDNALGSVRQWCDTLVRDE